MCHVFTSLVATLNGSDPVFLLSPLPPMRLKTWQTWQSRTICIFFSYPMGTTSITLRCFNPPPPPPHPWMLGTSITLICFHSPSAHGSEYLMLSTSSITLRWFHSPPAHGPEYLMLGTSSITLRCFFLDSAAVGTSCYIKMKHKAI